MTVPVLHPAAWTYPAARPFVALGGACVIGGGLASAALAPAASYHSSWAVAYVVLIAGVAQAALGLGQSVLVGGEIGRRTVRAELVGWNLGNTAVVAGTVLNMAGLLYVGCALLIVALVLVLQAIRHAPPGRVLLTTRIIVVILLVSMPIGIVVQALTH